MKLNNLRIYTIASSLSSFSWGIVGPFYFLYVNQLGGGNLQQFGIAFGIMIFMASLVSLITGRFSDKLGRKPFLVGTSLVYAVVLYSYTLITSVVELYILQALFGIIDAIAYTVDTSLLGDITKKSKRGFQVGVIRSIVNMFAGTAVILGGLIADKTGFKIIFYIGTILIAIESVVLLGLKETVRRRK
ncbi:MAG: MFS transporter [Candidatus Aenigmarchaeota archaeon]|nr:MFS transporter [Candidatus Aenigmarchaeota archaeon]